MNTTYTSTNVKRGQVETWAGKRHVADTASAIIKDAIVKLIIFVAAMATAWAIVTYVL